MKKYFYGCSYLIVLCIILFSCANQEEEVAFDCGPGPCYESQLCDSIIYNTEPLFSKKGTEEINNIEQETGSSIIMNSVLSSDPKTDLFCTELWFELMVFDVNKYSDLIGTSRGRIIMKKFFKVFSDECKNIDDFSDVRFNIVFKHNEKKQYESFYYDLYKDSIY